MPAAIPGRFQMCADLSLAARVISEGQLPARSALLQGPRATETGPVPADRLRGMLLGLAIGDALGNTSEGMLPAERSAAFGEIRDYLPNPATAGRRVGLPSDDTQLAFRTLDSLIQNGALDPESLAERFAAEEIFGLGSTVRKFLQNREAGITPWYRCGVQSAGNGALMRIAPVVLLHPQGSSAALWLDAAMASIVTHRDAASVAACVAFADLLSRLLRLSESPTPEWLLSTFLENVRMVCTDQTYRARGGRYGGWEGPFADYLEHVLAQAGHNHWDSLEACEAWHSGAYLLETVPCVLWILSRHLQDPEEAIVRAVNDTRDNDTIAALVGAAIGALHGEQGLPRRWRAGLLGRTGSGDDGELFRLIGTAVRTDWSGG